MKISTREKFSLILGGIGAMMVGISLLAGSPNTGFLVGSSLLVVAGLIIWMVEQYF